MKSTPNVILPALFALLLFFSACNNSANKEKEKIDKMSPTKASTTVQTRVLQKQSFSTQLLSNGKLEASERTSLVSVLQSSLTKVKVHSGSRVRKGELLFELDSTQSAQEKATAYIALQKSKLEYTNIIIQQGYEPEKPNSIPKEVKSIARLRSGLESDELHYKNMCRNLDLCQIRAPFSGRIANLKVKKHDQLNGSNPICELINDQVFEVRFKILETEVSKVHLGDSLHCSPISSNSEYTGSVQAMNPYVDENGLVEIIGLVNNSKSKLLDGMNVRIKLNHKLGSRLVVPNEAVVLRQNRNVVFVCEKGLASWKYVTVGERNATHCFIEEGLAIGDSVVVSNNVNLAHETPILAVNE